VTEALEVDQIVRADANDLRRWCRRGYELDARQGDRIAGGWGAPAGHDHGRPSRQGTVDRLDRPLGEVDEAPSLAAASPVAGDLHERDTRDE
jgi:hypothetical protein